MVRAARSVGFSPTYVMRRERQQETKERGKKNTGRNLKKETVRRRMKRKESGTVTMNLRTSRHLMERE
jgi:hypothetical protein